MKKIFITLLGAVLLFSCHDTKIPEKEKEITPEVAEIPVINYSLVKTFPHDTTSYTQGLLFYDNKVFESTGSPIDQKQTRSVFGILDTITGKINVKAELDRTKYFGEGLAILNNKIYQLTWKNHVAFIYDAKTFKALGQFTFENKEGWGLTTDGTYLVMSDGTNTISYMDATTFKIIKTITVADYANLNELEFINGFIYANVYQKDFIIKIDPAKGNVVGIVDFGPLVYKAQQRSAGAEVLNGIAFDPLTNKILITGKLWADIYQVEFPH